MECGNPKLITNIENLWMIIHQKPYVLPRKMITLGMAQGLVYELNGKQMNRLAYDEWTNQKQFQRHHAKVLEFFEDYNLSQSK